MSEPLAFLNGRVVPQSQAHLTLHDAGFVMGATVTDLCRTVRHRLYRWPDHLRRFRESCRLARIDLAFDDAVIKRHAEELVSHNTALIHANSDLALVLLATPGPIGYYLGESALSSEPTFGMHTFPLPFRRYWPWIEHGITLMTPSIRAVPAACVDPRIKQRSRMHWWLAAREVAPEAHALLLDDAGNVTETASANFLLVRNGVIAAPPVGSVLEGVSLGVVQELCGRLGISMERRPIALEECYDADEAMLTCTSYFMAGVCRINDRAIPWPGPMQRRLVEAWSAHVGLDVHAQIRNASAR